MGTVSRLKEATRRRSDLAAQRDHEEEKRQAPAAAEERELLEVLLAEPKLTAWRLPRYP